MIFRFFLNNLISQTYKKREGDKVLSYSLERKVTGFNEAIRLFHTELRTTSAPDHSVCYMLAKDSEKVQLIAYRYDKKSDLEGNGKVFKSLDLAREFAFNKGYIIPEPDRDTNK